MPPNGIGMLCDVCEETVTEGTLGLSVMEYRGEATQILAVFHNACWVGALRWAGRAALKERKAKEVKAEQPPTDSDASHRDEPPRFEWD